MRNKRFLALPLVAAIMMTATAASASTITYIYSGGVLACNEVAVGVCDISLSVGDNIGGFLDIDSAAIVPGGVVGSSDISDFAFDFGTLIEFNSSNSMITSSFIGVDGDGNLDGGAVVITAMMVIPGTDGQRLTLNVGANFWDITAFVGGNSVVIANGFGKIAPVPVPGALLLFAPALLGFLGLRRKAA